MTKISSATLRAHLLRHPGATTPEIALALHTTTGRASVACTNSFALGYVRREVVPGGRGKRYAYFATDKPLVQRAPPKVKVPPDTPRVKALPFEATMEQMAKTLADQILARAKEHLAAAMSTLVPTLKPAPLPEVTTHADAVPTFDDTPATEAPAPRVKPLPALRKLAVIGLSTHQEGLIAQEFRDKLELKFLTSDAGARSVLPVRACEKSLVMTGFISHKVINNLKSLQAKYEFVNGGLTSLREVLRKEYDRV